MSNYGFTGWYEFSQNRDSILNKYDEAKKLSHNRAVKTEHGFVVESSIREWFDNFLPKKYAVTKGYVIPDVYEENNTLLEYDIIIYNQIESPVLWVNCNQGQSDADKSKAIPANYVVAIYEVKSKLDTRNAKDAVNKLSELNQFKDHLPSNFSSGIIFVELMNDSLNSKKILKHLYEGRSAYGFWGGIALRSELDPETSGFIVLNSHGGPKERGYIPDIPIMKRIEDLNIYLNPLGNLVCAEKGAGVRLMYVNDNWSVTKEFCPTYVGDDVSIQIRWSHTAFSEFAIELISKLEGLSYNDQRRPCYGTVFDNIKRKEPEIQSNEPCFDKPFISLDLVLDNDGNCCRIESVDDKIFIVFDICIKNIGSKLAMVSYDLSEKCSPLNIDESKYISKSQEINILNNASSEHISSFIEKFYNNNVYMDYECNFSVIYYPEDDENTFYIVSEYYTIKNRQSYQKINKLNNK